MNGNHEKLLPGFVTSITPQKNNKNRFSIFVDEQFLLGVSNETMLKRQLKQGIEITPAFFKKLQRDEGRNKVKSYFLKLISRRQHARKELLRKAQQKDYSNEMIEDVLYELEEKGFINDERFALKYATDKGSLKKWGPRKIVAHLRKKGVGRVEAQSAVSKAFKSTDMESRLKELTFKRQKHFLREEDELKRKQKAVNYLLQKGYNSGTIFKNIDSILQALKEKHEN